MNSLLSFKTVASDSLLSLKMNEFLERLLKRFIKPEFITKENVSVNCQM